MRISILVLLLFFGGFKLKAQTIHGKVIDEVSGEAVPFVSIGQIGSNNTTITNDAGEFVLKDVKFPVQLRFSHVSYMLTTVNATQAENFAPVKLKPAAISLNTVTIDPYRGQRLVKAALEKTKQHERDMFYGNAFYRQLTTVNQQPTQIYELFYDLQFGASGVKGWLAKQSRFAKVNKGVAFSMNNQSYLTFSLAGSLLPEKKEGKFVSLKTLKDFAIAVDRIILQNEQDIAVVSCKYKGNKKNFYINTTYYIGTDDHKIYRTESKLYNLPIAVNATAGKIPPYATVTATFNGTETAIPILENISTKMFLNFSAGSTVIRPVISSSLIVYQLDKTINNQKFSTLNKNVKDKAIVESIAYNPVFWQDNPIVKQTSLEDNFIKMMESKSAFGTMINP